MVLMGSRRFSAVLLGSRRQFSVVLLGSRRFSLVLVGSQWFSWVLSSSHRISVVLNGFSVVLLGSHRYTFSRVMSRPAAMISPTLLEASSRGAFNASSAVLLSVSDRLKEWHMSCIPA